MTKRTFVSGLALELAAIVLLASAVEKKCDVVVPSPGPTVSPTIAPTAQPTPTPEPTAEPTTEPTAPPTPPATGGAVIDASDDDPRWTQDAARPTDQQLFDALNLAMRELALVGLGLPADSERCWIGTDGSCKAPEQFTAKLEALLRSRGWYATARGDDTIMLSRSPNGSWHADVLTSQGNVIWQRHRETWYWYISGIPVDTVGPTPQPTVAPTPGPTPTPDVSGCDEPRMAASVLSCGPWQGHYDCTPKVSRACDYCAAIGMGEFNGLPRCECPMRPDGHPQKDACERYSLGGWTNIENRGTACVHWRGWDGEGQERMLQVSCGSEPGRFRVCGLNGVCSDWLEVTP